MNKCGCNRVEGITPAEARSMTMNECENALPQYLKDLLESVDLTCGMDYGGNHNPCLLYGNAFGKAVK